MEQYKEGGTSSYHPKMMLKVMLYGYLTNHAPHLSILLTDALIRLTTQDGRSRTMNLKPNLPFGVKRKHTLYITVYSVFGKAVRAYPYRCLSDIVAGGRITDARSKPEGNKTSNCFFSLAIFYFNIVP